MKDFLIGKIIAPGAEKLGLPYHPVDGMNIGEFFELHKKTMQHIIYPSFEQVGLDDKGYLSVLRKIRNLLCHPKTSKNVNLIKYLLQPCSFGQAVVMMEKGAVMFSHYYDQYCKFSDKLMGQFEIFDADFRQCGWISMDTYVRDLIGSKFQYAPWFNDRVVDQDVKDFCDEILGVKND